MKDTFLQNFDTRPVSCRAQFLSVLSFFRVMTKPDDTMIEKLAASRQCRGDYFSTRVKRTAHYRPREGRAHLTHRVAKQHVFDHSQRLVCILVKSTTRFTHDTLSSRAAPHYVITEISSIENSQSEARLK